MTLCKSTKYLVQANMYLQFLSQEVAARELQDHELVPCGLVRN